MQTRVYRVTAAARAHIVMCYFQRKIARIPAPPSSSLSRTLSPLARGNMCRDRVADTIGNQPTRTRFRADLQSGIGLYLA